MQLYDIESSLIGKTLRLQEHFFFFESQPLWKGEEKIIAASHISMLFHLYKLSM